MNWASSCSEDEQRTALFSLQSPLNTQLLRLTGRLKGKGLISQWTIERNQAHWEPPWAPKAPIEIIISRDSKEKEAQQHKALIELLFNNNNNRLSQPPSDLPRSPHSLPHL